MRSFRITNLQSICSIGLSLVCGMSFFFFPYLLLKNSLFWFKASRQIGKVGKTCHMKKKIHWRTYKPKHLELASSLFRFVFSLFFKFSPSFLTFPALWERVVFCCLNHQFFKSERRRREQVYSQPQSEGWSVTMEVVCLGSWSTN